MKKQATKTRSLVGRVFDRLTVTALHHIDEYRHRWWSCRCSCGQKAIVRSNGLLTARTRSCGCLRADATIRRNARMMLSRQRRRHIAQLGAAARRKS